MKMKKAVLYEPEDVRIIDDEIPVPSKGEVVIKNKIALTCGTDVKMYKRGYPKLTPPFAMGHEGSGEVYSVGEGVTKFKVGDRVVAHNSAPCNECYYCKKGLHSMCENLLINNSKNGTFSEYQLIPERIVNQNMFKLDDDMTFKQAALLEPFACAVYGVATLPVMQGDYVVVNGCGPIGLMFVRLLYLKGARVIVCDFKEKRLARAKKQGAHDIINLNDVKNQHEAIKALTPEGRGVDAAIEAAGTIEAWEESLLSLRPGGCVSFFGGTKVTDELKVDTKLLHYSQITLQGLYHTTPLYVNQAFEMLKAKVIDEKDFVQNEYKLSQMKEAIFDHAKGEVVKNCIVLD